jgi:hypothetical protein
MQSIDPNQQAAGCLGWGENVLTHMGFFTHLPRNAGALVSDLDA